MSPPSMYAGATNVQLPQNLLVLGVLVKFFEGAEVVCKNVCKIDVVLGFVLAIISSIVA